MLKLSKAIVDGSLVSTYGDKYILASSRSKISGVFQSSREQRIITDDGVKIITYPRGVVNWGYAEIKIR